MSGSGFVSADWRVKMEVIALPLWLWWTVLGLQGMLVFMVAVLVWIQDRRWRRWLATILFQRQRQMAFSLQLQAYERLVLLMERLNPSELVRRELRVPDQPLTDFYSHLITVVRTEFMHNVTQQVYVSERAWREVVQARDFILEILTKAAQRARQQWGEHARAKHLPAALKAVLEGEDNLVHGACHVLREETRQFLGTFT